VAHNIILIAPAPPYSKGWRAGVRFPGGARFLSPPQLQTGSGVDPASYPMDAGDSFPWGSKAARA
jgi:hypothetical protein